MPYLPEMNQTCKRTTGASGIPPNTVIFTGKKCAFWLTRGRQDVRAAYAEPLIWGQVALTLDVGWQPAAWRGNPPTFNAAAADILQITTPGGPTMAVLAVNGAPMWAGTSYEHFRVNVSQIWSTTPILPISFFTGRTDGITVVISISRPFNGPVITTGVAAVRYADWPAGRGSYSGGNYLPWTDYFDVASSVDVRDGTSRSAGLDVVSWSDGDRITVTNPATNTVYVVTYVQNMKDLSGVLFKRVYVTRDQPGWPGP